ncbi:MAG TPA: DNA repair protein RecO [Chromatiales bacterium]|nr:DNA repair protein RecO [Chromatiales bacterium]
MGSGDDLHAAFILHRREFRNSSLILELFVRKLGRLPAVARGVRGKKRGESSLYEPFRPLLVRLAGRGDVRTLIGIEAAGDAPKLKARELYCGFYVNELLMRLLGRDDAHVALFDRYHTVLYELAEGEIEQTLRRFELHLLQELGYAMMLDQVAGTGKPVERGQRYAYVPEVGPTMLAPDETKGYRGETLLALAGELPLDEEGKKEARHLMRAVLARYLGDKPLKSRELFQMMQK